MVTTTANGIMLGVYEPNYYGKYKCLTGYRPDTMGITGKLHDNDADLDYFNARWYDPERGSFISKDPVFFAGGINLYAFCFNNPINSVDPDGMMPLSVMLAAMNCVVAFATTAVYWNCLNDCWKSWDAILINPNIPLTMKPNPAVAKSSCFNQCCNIIDNIGMAAASCLGTALGRVLIMKKFG